MRLYWGNIGINENTMATTTEGLGFENKGSGLGFSWSRGYIPRN